MDVELLKRLLRYDPKRGKLFWRHRDPECFEDGYHRREGKAANWNSRYAGKEALTAYDRYGYLRGSLLNSQVYAHRVAYCLHHGLSLADGDEVDHINGNRTDNRIANLRCVKHADNMRNAALRDDNKSGVSGVYWVKGKNRWAASIRVRGSRRFLGYFDDLGRAAAARKAAERRLDFHPNHGRAA